MGKPFFAKKLKVLLISHHTIFFQFHQHMIQILIKQCMERIWICNVSLSNGNIKCLIGKSIFAVNLPLKLFHATVANTDTRSLKSLHTLFYTYLDHMLVKFKPNRIVQNVEKFELFDKNPSFLKPFMTKL